VFILEQIELNMMKECVVTLGFNKDNVKFSLTPLVQELHSYYNKTIPQKTKGTKLEQGGASS
jgi:hypothetical protein